MNQNYYDAEVRSLDFSDPTAVDTINQWCSDKTDSKIKKILEIIPSETVMYLINAIYFNGTWKFQFDTLETKQQPFYLEDGTTRQIEMMQMEANVNYLNNELCQGIELPYGKGHYSMVCILPKGGRTVNNLIGQMTNEKWNKWMNQLNEKMCGGSAQI